MLVDNIETCTHREAEALTSVLIFINKNHQVDGAGVRITGRLIDPAPG